jgi:hypothetical protein
MSSTDRTAPWSCTDGFTRAAWQAYRAERDAAATTAPSAALCEELGVGCLDDIALSSVDSLDRVTISALLEDDCGFLLDDGLLDALDDEGSERSCAPQTIDGTPGCSASTFRRRPALWSPAEHAAPAGVTALTAPRRARRRGPRRERTDGGTKGLP